MPKQEVFMVRVMEIQLMDDECLEHVQLDDYYIDNDDDTSPIHPIKIQTHAE
jgi:hypothetical protein